MGQETTRRVNEIVALEQELQITRMQFVAGDAQWQAVISDIEGKITDARDAGNDGLARGYQGALDRVNDFSLDFSGKFNGFRLCNCRLL